MLKIGRICIANYGHKDATFRGNIIDFRTDRRGKLADSVMLHAPNGNGKTSILSMMLHMFVPHRRNFVQTLQKSHHKFWDYVTPGRPAFFVMELARKEGMLDEARPALVLGSMMTRTNSETRKEVFFLIEPTPQYGFDNIEFVAEIVSGNALDWTNAEAGNWISGLRNRRDIKFKSTESIEDWKALLNSHRVSLAEFESQVKMASSEGGVEEFLNSGKPGEILDRILSMIIDEDGYSQRLEAINDYLARNEDMPRKRAIHENLARVLEAEVEFAESFTAYDLVDREHLQMASNAKGVLQALEAARTSCEANKTALEERKRDIDAKASGLQSERRAAVAMKEAVRITSTRADRIQKEETIASLIADKRSTEIRASAAEASPRLRQVRSSTSEFERAKEKLADIQAGRHAALEPVNAAGRRLLDALTREIEASEMRIKLVSANIRREDDTQNSGQQGFAEGTAKKEKLVAQLDEAKRKRSELRRVLSDYMPGSIDESEALVALASAVNKYRHSVSGLKEKLKSNSNMIQESALRRGNANARLEFLLKELARFKSQSSDAEQRLQSFKEAVGGYECDFPGLLPFLGGISLLSKDAKGRLDQAASDAERNLNDAISKRGDIDKKKSEIIEVGSFDDDDIRKALDMCREAGVKDAAPYVKWISENAPDRSTAKAAVESNLDVCLGVRVHHKADLEKIEKSFDREKWRLNKPIAVTVVRSIDDLGGAIRAGQFVLSASTDYAYHEASRIERIAHLGKILEDLDHRIAKAEKDLGTKKSARDAHSELVRQFGYSTEGDFRSAAETIARQTSQAEAAAESARIDVQSCEADRQAMQALSDRLTGEHERESRALEEADRLHGSACAIHSGLLTHSEIVAMEEGIHRLSEEIKACEAAARASKERYVELVKEQTILNGRITSLRQEQNGIVYARTTADGSASLDVDACRTEYNGLLESYNAQHDHDTKLTLAEKDLKNARGNKENAEGTFIEIMNRIPDADREYFRSLTEHFADMSGTIAEGEARALRSRIAYIDSDLERYRSSVAVLEENEKPRGEAAEDGVVREALERLLADPGKLSSPEINDDLAIGTLIQVEGRIKEAASLAKAAAEAIIENGAILGEANLAIAHLQDAHATDVAAAAAIELPAWREWTALSKETLQSYRKSAAVRRNAYGKAAGLHDDIVAMACADGMDLGSPQLSDRFTSFSSFIEHGEHAERIVALARKAVESQDAELRRVEAEEESVLKSVSEMGREAVRIVGEAARAKIPEGSSTFGGLPIMKLPKGVKIEQLRSLPLDDLARSWLAETQSNAKLAPKSMHALCTRLLEMMVKRLGKTEFDLLLLKPVFQSKDPVYEPAHKMTGSGGQTITAALLLNMLANFIRHKGANGAGCGFIILDNPIGKANSMALVGTQIDVAKAFDIQLISTSGIKDMCIGCYEWIVTFSAARRFGDRNAIAVGYSENEVTNAHISLIMEDAA